LSKYINKVYRSNNGLNRYISALQLTKWNRKEDEGRIHFTIEDHRRSSWATITNVINTPYCDKAKNRNHKINDIYIYIYILL